MPSLKELKARISSVKQTQKITSAMKLVAASKLKKAQDRAEASRPYAEKMAEMLANLSAGVRGLPDAPALLAGAGEDKVELLLVMTADRGLCGGFNSSIVRGARKRVLEGQAAGKTMKLVCVGRKGRDALRREFGDLIIRYFDDVVGKKEMGFADASKIGEFLTELYDEGGYDRAFIVYNMFKSAISQELTFKQVVPVEPAEESEEEAAKVEEAGSLYEFEPTDEAILESLLPRNLSVQIFGALVENAASEQGARMAAMDSATRNAGEMIRNLTLQYNRTRQAMITKELIEIISGAEAV